MTCYRFAAAAFDWSLAMLYARLTENPSFRSKLSTDEYRSIDNSLSADDRSAILSSLDISSLTAMDNTVRNAIDRMFRNGYCLASMSDEELPTQVFERMSGFLIQELQCV